MTISILGCGAYGQALASVLLNNNINIKMWNKFEGEINKLKNIYKEITFSTDLKTATENTDLIIIAIPINFIKDTLISLKEIYNQQDILVASKGIDTNTNKFAIEIIKEVLNINNIGVISGGSFAIDMQNKKVLGLTLATKTPSIKEKVLTSLANNYIKIQCTNDLIGVSVCGSIKNVMAIGFGILDGASYPESSRFLFLTKAIYEINYLINELKGNSKTIMSYAGLDDITMTCTSKKSRNYTLGQMIGSKSSEEEINNYKKETTIEGLTTAKAIYNLAQEKSINLPITSLIYKILYNNLEPNSLIEYLENN